MSTPLYKFLNLHISIWIKYFIGSGLMALFLFTLFGYPLWIVPCAIGVVALIIYIVTYSSISIDYGLKTSKIIIKDALKSVTLESPIQADIWWNYTFRCQSDGVIDLNDGSGTMPAREDDINVILELRDKNGQKVTFVEKIVFDFRFPNEANYSLEKVDETVPQFKVQRVDKLMKFLEHHIAE